MRLEALSEGITAPPVTMPLTRDAGGTWRSDWAPLLPLLLDTRLPLALRAARFHISLAQTLCEQASALRRDCGVMRVGLAGGVFQNRVLSEQVSAQLRAAGFEVLIPQQLPVNDAAISYGQLVEMAASAAD